MEEKKLTAANGRPIADNQNTQTAGQRGPVHDAKTLGFLRNSPTLTVK